jgi:drug/metabolite transporter (DMT)-like permease
VTLARFVARRDGPAAVRRAILLLIVAMACLTAMDTIAKVLTAAMPVMQVAWARFFFLFVALAPIFVGTPFRSLIRTGNLRLQLARGFLQLPANICFLTALYYLPLADAVAVAFSAPLFIVAFSALWLGERVDWRNWTAVGIGMIGVLVIVRPGFGEAHWALVLPLITAIVFALFQVMTRILGRTDSSLTIVFYSNLVGLIGTGAVLPFVWQAPSVDLWLMMAALGLLAAVGHYLMIEAFSTAPASVLAPFTYVELIWAAAIGYLLFGDLPGPYVVVGSVIVVAAGIFTVLQDR